MSIQAVAWAIEQKTGSPAGKVVLMCIANYADEAGECWPAQAKIAAETELSERAVRDWLQRLEKAGFLEREHRQRTDGSRKSDLIRLKIHPANSAGRTPSNRQDVPSQPAGGAGLTSFEPSLEPSEESILSGPGPDGARKPKAKRTYPADFEAFWLSYPRTPNMSKTEAFDEWRKLDAEDRTLCAQAVPAFRSFLASKRDLEIQHAYRFIKKRRFEGFVEQSAPAAEATDEQWRKRLTFGRQRQCWASRDWGPPPGQPGCRVPASLLQAGDGNGWSEWVQAA